MKITILQRDIIWADKVQNARLIDIAIDKNPGSDLYILPEMFSTGFCTHPEGLAEQAEGDTLQWMRRKAAEKDAAIAGSLAVCENGQYFNRFYFVWPNGQVEHYDKRHLFAYGGEDQQYVQGNRRVVVDFRGVRILLETCYDLRFPIWSRYQGDYDMIIYVASWPTSRIEAWNTLLHARAIENQCYVAGVNRVGHDNVCDYCGGSVLVDPYGRTIAECVRGAVCEVTSEIDIERLKAFRQKFPVWRDADAFELK